MANISSYPVGTPASGDLIPGTQVRTDENNNTVHLTKNFSVDSIAGFANTTAAYSVYSAQWTQTGTSAPVPTVLQNTTGKTFTWTRASAGNYSVTADTAFDTAKIWIMASANGDTVTSPASTGASVISATTSSTTVLKVKQIDAADKSLVDVVEGGNIEIRIYT